MSESNLPRNSSDITPTDLYIDLPTHRAHLFDWGRRANSPAILLIHGAASNAKMWSLVAPKLAQNFRVVALEQRSHGLSGAPIDNDFSFAAVCGDMQLICAHLNIQRPIVVGHSWGSNVALEYAGRHADNVAGVVMIEGGFAGAKTLVTWPQFERMATPPRWAGKPLVEYLEHHKRLWGDRFSADVLDEMMGNIEVRSDQTIVPYLTYDDHVQIQRATWEQDSDTLYTNVKLAALFLWSLPPQPHDAQTERLLDWKRKTVAPQIQAAMPQAQIEWLADSLHDVPLQRPELIAEKIRAFVGAS